MIATLTITAQTDPWRLFAVVDQQISCYGNNDGYIHAWTYPNAVFDFKIKGKGYSAANNHGHFHGLKTGSYTVTATDGGGAKQRTVLKIEKAYKLHGKIIVIEHPTKGQSNGTVQIDIRGGTAHLQPHLVEWWKDGVQLNDHPDQNWQNLMTDLSSGKYHFILQDDNGCFWDKYYTLYNKSSIGAKILPSQRKVIVRGNGNGNAIR